MQTARYVAALILIAVLVCIACAGCTTTRPEQQGVTLPSAPSTVQAPTVTVSDTLRHLPPVLPRGVRTAPLRQRTYTKAPDTPTVSTDRVTVSQDPAEVEIQYRIGDSVRVETWPLPAWGETLDIEADTDTSTAAQVRGEPTSRNAEAIVSVGEPSRWSRWGDALNHLLTFAAGAFVGAIAGRFIL